MSKKVFFIIEQPIIPGWDKFFTQNLIDIAKFSDLFSFITQPDIFGITTAHQLLIPLEKGLKILKDMPEYFENLNSGSVYNDYSNLINFVESYIAMIKEYPDAAILVKDDEG